MHRQHFYHHTKRSVIFIFGAIINVVCGSFELIHYLRHMWINKTKQKTTKKNFISSHLKPFWYAFMCVACTCIWKLVMTCIDCDVTIKLHILWRQIYGKRPTLPNGWNTKFRRGGTRNLSPEGVTLRSTIPLLWSKLQESCKTMFTCKWNKSAYLL
jgi:hypothetical protein